MVIHRAFGALDGACRALVFEPQAEGVEGRCRAWLDAARGGSFVLHPTDRTST
jgi:hypothetical protein